MFAHDCNSTRPRPEIKMVETQTPNGKVKVDESLWGSWKTENDSSLITLNNGITLKIKPDYEQTFSLKGLFDWSHYSAPQLKDDAEIEIANIDDCINIKLKNATVKIDSQNKSSDKLIFDNPKDSKVFVSNDSSDSVCYKIDNQILTVN